MKRYRLLLSTLLLSGLCLVATAHTQRAWARCTDCGTVALWAQLTRERMQQEHDQTREHIRNEFDAWEDWLENTFVPAFMPPEYLVRMAGQLTETAVYQVFAIGTLLDAKQALEVQRVFQKKIAEAHRDYQPSVGVCAVGTTIRSLADAERRAETTTFVLSQRAQDRQIGNMHTAAAAGGTSDKANRLAQFRRRYCDVHDNNDVFMRVCGSGNAARAATINKDIDYTRTVDAHRTMNIDFTDANLTEDEEDVMALASNLYAHEMMERLPEISYNSSSTSQRADRLRQIIAQRQIIAKRSVAEHSFNTIVGLKSYGSPAADNSDEGSSIDTARYLKIILQQLGMSEEEAGRFMGERPSYFTQMEIVTKKVFQQPTFYADLYDKPANIDRKKAALQAVSLMQDFDTWQSYLRTESLLSVLLEIEVAKFQAGAAENRKAGGARR